MAEPRAINAIAVLRALDGSESVEAIDRFLDDAMGVLTLLIDRYSAAMCDEDIENMREIYLGLSALQLSRVPEAETPVKMEFVQPRGRPRVGRGGVVERKAIARRVLADVDAGEQVEAAVAAAQARSRLSRSEIYKWLATVRQDDARFAEQVEIWARRKADGGMD